ncbi:MAG TPA: histidine kinase [Chitinophagaceae bacterium]|nr:histidine kinase [Chitinophagaceae bacterium]
MQWHEFIFSEKRQIRLLRHILFWIAWAMYFLLCDYVFQIPNHSSYVYGQTKTGFVILGTASLLKVLILICLYASACYVFIYVLLPQLIKSQWLKAITNILLLCSVLFVLAWFMYWNLFPFIDSLYGPYKVNDYFARFWPAIYLGIINAGKVVAIAAIIKYVKYWWLKQKEKQKLEREKMNTELQLLKAQIRPGFLFNSLNNIRDYSIIASPQAPESLLKLSDLLSYMLYECDKPLVPLDKEIAMMKHYMELEKTSPGRSFEMGINTRGKLDDKLIAPFLLLPFIENSFKQSSALNGNAWIIMDIGLEENWFFMKLANGIVAGTNGSAEQETNDLSNVQKRLSLIYPQHELKIYPEQEMLITHLKIHLTDTTTTLKKENEDPVLEEQD